jgi:oxygen-independent coproporphyrinogen-3 oxidase
MNGYYIGIGAGAHSHLPEKRFWNINSPKQYTNLLTNNQVKPNIDLLPPVIDKSEYISKELEMAETMILGLRLLEGIDAYKFESRFKSNPLIKYSSTISDLVNLNLIYIENHQIKLTNQGLLLGNEVFSRILENVQ